MRSSGAKRPGVTGRPMVRVELRAVGTGVSVDSVCSLVGEGLDTKKAKWTRGQTLTSSEGVAGMVRYVGMVGWGLPTKHHHIYVSRIQGFQMLSEKPSRLCLRALKPFFCSTDLFGRQARSDRSWTNKYQGVFIALQMVLRPRGVVQGEKSRLSQTLRHTGSRP